MWEYVKGSERDFEGVPDCALFILGNKYLRYWAKDADSKIEGYIVDSVEIIAERRKVDDLRSRTNDANLQQAFDTVQRPVHYNQSGIECIDAIAAAVKGKSGIEAACVANVIKYLWRYELKNGVEDVRKAQWYLDRLVKELSK
jgi:Protein of unknwon function (DUF3310).